MTELKIHADDNDLLPLLQKCTKDDLDPIVECLLQKGGITSELDKTHTYKMNRPTHPRYADEICAEIQRFGGHTLINIFRGGKGIYYKEIVCDVADKFKVNYNKKREIEVIEEQILLRVLEKSWEKMSEKEKAEFLEAAGLSVSLMNSGRFPLTAFQALFQMGGFKSYQVMLVIANAVWKFIFGKGLTLAANAGLTRFAAILTGPIGWSLTAIWTISDLLGPAYRVTVPIVFHIAMLRKAVKLREMGQEPAIGVAA
jgi:uncharacterized protein YaaW (UPF0174 family)